MKKSFLLTRSVIMKPFRKILLCTVIKYFMLYGATYLYFRYVYSAFIFVIHSNNEQYTGYGNVARNIPRNIAECKGEPCFLFPRHLSLIFNVGALIMNEIRGMVWFKCTMRCDMKRI